MGKRLFVGGLSWGTTEDALRQAFAAFGVVVSVKIISDRDTGKSKGFGFVEMDSDEAAQKAMAGMNGQDFEGRKLTVNVAKPMEDRPHRPAGFDQGPRDFNRSSRGFSDRPGGGFNRGRPGGSGFRRGAR